MRCSMPSVFVTHSAGRATCVTQAMRDGFRRRSRVRGCRMRFAWLLVLAACGSDGANGPPLVAKTSFVVTDKTGAGTSPLDPLYMQTIDIEIVFPEAIPTKGYEGDTPECKSKLIDAPMAMRTALGDTAQLVQ